MADKQGIQPSIKRASAELTIGSLSLGGRYPVRIQSMTNTPTKDTKATINQCIELFEAGSELVRISVPSLADVTAMRTIVKNLRTQSYHFPIIADVHFNPLIAEKLAHFVDKVRINPETMLIKNLSSLLIIAKLPISKSWIELPSACFLFYRFVKKTEPLCA